MTGKVAAALVAAQAELHNPKKDATADTGRFSYSYATLASVLDLVRPVLAKHGLAVAQDVRMGEGGMSVYTIVMHSSGDQLIFGPILGRAGIDWQQLGGGISYARRYGLMAALGLAADDDDDDANLADGKTAQVVVKPKPKPDQRQQEWERMDPTTAVAAPYQGDPDPWQTPELGENAAQALLEHELGATVVDDEAPIMVPNTIKPPLSKSWGTEPATEPQRKLLGVIAREQGYENTAAFLASQEVQELLGGVCSNPIKKGHAKPILDHYRGSK